MAKTARRARKAIHQTVLAPKPGKAAGIQEPPLPNVQSRRTERNSVRFTSKANARRARTAHSTTMGRAGSILQALARRATNASSHTGIPPVQQCRPLIRSLVTANRRLEKQLKQQRLKLKPPKKMHEMEARGMEVLIMEKSAAASYYRSQYNPHFILQWPLRNTEKLKSLDSTMRSTSSPFMIYFLERGSWTTSKQP
jgi:hypothetical protein